MNDTDSEIVLFLYPANEKWRYNVFVPSQWEMTLPCNVIIVLFLCRANERWRYIVTLSLIGLVHTQNDPRRFSAKPEHISHVVDDIVTLIFLYAICYISIQMSLKLFLIDPINNNPAFVQIMAWWRTCNKSLCEWWPSVLMHRHFTRLQCVTHTGRLI